MNIKLLIPIFIILFLFSCSSDSKVIKEPEKNNNEIEEIQETKEIGKNDFTKALNKIRMDGGEKPVKWDEELARASKIHSNDMNENDFFSHEGSDGSSFVVRVRRTNFDGNPLGENIAKCGSYEIAINLWKNSSGHYKNMMKSSATHVGYFQVGSYHTMITGRK